MWVNIIDKTDSSYVIGVIYHHPSQVLINAFIEDLSNCLTDYNKYNKNNFILGNLNINIFTINRSPEASDVTNPLISCGTFPIITKPTRFTDSTDRQVFYLSNSNKNDTNNTKKIKIVLFENDLKTTKGL